MLRRDSKKIFLCNLCKGNYALKTPIFEFSNHEVLLYIKDILNRKYYQMARNKTSGSQNPSTDTEKMVLSASITYDESGEQKVTCDTYFTSVYGPQFGYSVVANTDQVGKDLATLVRKIAEQYAFEYKDHDKEGNVVPLNSNVRALIVERIIKAIEDDLSIAHE